MSKGYIAKDEVISIIREAYQIYLPQAHGVIMHLENRIAELETVEAEEVVHAKWIPSRKHLWERRPNGEVNQFAWDYEFHNGPWCVVCGKHPCVHCEPDWENLEDCEKEHYVCSRCGEKSPIKSTHCSCGALMDQE